MTSGTTSKEIRLWCIPSRLPRASKKQGVLPPNLLHYKAFPLIDEVCSYWGIFHFKGISSFESFQSSQVPERKSLDIRFRSFCRKFSLSPNLLSWMAHSTSGSEKESKTLKLHWHYRLQPARINVPIQGTSRVIYSVKHLS